MHLGVQRLHAPAEHFRPAGQLGHVAHGNSRVAQQLRGPAGGNDLDSQRRKLPREFRDAGFVIDADERPLDGHSRASPNQLEGNERASVSVCGVFRKRMWKMVEARDFSPTNTLRK